MSGSHERTPEPLNIFAEDGVNLVTLQPFVEDPGIVWIDNADYKQRGVAQDKLGIYGGVEHTTVDFRNSASWIAPLIGKRIDYNPDSQSATIRHADPENLVAIQTAIAELVLEGENARVSKLVRADEIDRDSASTEEYTPLFLDAMRNGYWPIEGRSNQADPSQFDISTEHDSDTFHIINSMLLPAEVQDIVSSIAEVSFTKRTLDHGMPAEFNPNTLVGFDDQLDASKFHNSNNGANLVDLITDDVGYFEAMDHLVKASSESVFRIVAEEVFSGLTFDADKHGLSTMNRYRLYINELKEDLGHGIVFLHEHDTDKDKPQMTRDYIDSKMMEIASGIIRVARKLRGEDPVIGQITIADLENQVIDNSKGAGGEDYAD